jgi:hypothetical protein
MMDCLATYLKGRQSLRDVLAWEAEYSLALGVTGRLRADLNQLALIGEEVEAGLRDESEFRALSESLVRGAPARSP